MEEKPVYALMRQEDNKRTLEDGKIRELEVLFFMDGITPYRAGQITGIDADTCKRYFEDWAEQLIHDQDETWAQRQKRVRARALEGIAKKITDINVRKTVLETILSNLLYFKARDGELKLKSMGNMDHDYVLAYEAKIQAIDRQLTELQAEYDSIEAKPPAEIILRQELLNMLEEMETTL